MSVSTHPCPHWILIFFKFPVNLVSEICPCFKLIYLCLLVNINFFFQLYYLMIPVNLWHYHRVLTAPARSRSLVLNPGFPLKICMIWSWLMFQSFSFLLIQISITIPTSHVFVKNEWEIPCKLNLVWNTCSINIYLNCFFYNFFLYFLYFSLKILISYQF